MERQLEHAELRVLSELPVRERPGERVERPAAGAHHELADAVLRVAHLRRRLEGVALIDVVVAREDDVDVVRVEHLPERVVVREVSRRAGREPGLVPVGQRARRMVRGEVVPEEGHLRRRRAAAADVRAVGVERDQVPLADVEAVPAPGRVAGPASEVGEVAGAVAASGVLVVSGDGVGLPERASPAQVVGALEVRQEPGLVLLVAERQDGGDGGVPDEDVGRLQLAAGGGGDRAARRARDVARGGDDRRLRAGDGRRPQDRDGRQHGPRSGSPSPPTQSG